MSNLMHEMVCCYWFGGGKKKSKDSGQQVLPGKWEKTAGKDTGNIRYNGFKLRIIKWGLVYEVISGDI